MSEHDDPVFEAERSRLFGLAYRMLGTIADADDVVQETWIRWSAATDVDNPAAWMTTVATRLAIDRLRSAQRRRETYVGPWLPEPLVASFDDDPADIAEFSDSLTLGFLTVLDRLDPVDRAVFLLRDVFDLPYEQVAAAVDRTEANCRQIARRARDRVQQDRPVAAPPTGRRQELLDSFLGAVMSGDPAQLEALLTEDVVHVSDGGADRHAARRPVVGRERVARFFVNIGSRMPEGGRIEQRSVNGEPGFVLSIHGDPYLVMSVSFADGLVSQVYAVLNPDKLEAAIARGEEI